MIPVPGPRQTALLPPPCIKCGAPADGKPLEKTYYWHHPAVYLIILAGLFIYVIVALVVRKSIRVQTPLCLRHARRRSTAAMLAWLLPVIGIMDAFILPQFNTDGGLIALITTVLILTGLIIWAVVSNPIRPRFIDQFRSEFTGFSPAYLQRIPEDSEPSAPMAKTPPPPIP